MASRYSTVDQQGPLVLVVHVADHRSSGHTILKLLTQERLDRLVHTDVQWLQVVSAIGRNQHNFHMVFLKQFEHLLGYLTLELVKDQKRGLIFMEFHFTPGLLDVWEEDFLHVLNHGLLIGSMIL